LYVASSARDTDFTGKLVDVFPDGHAINLTDGALRARYHKSLNEPELLIPAQVYKLSIDLWATSNVFLPGHRIRLEVSSSNFPKLGLNMNTGGPTAHESLEQCVPAVNRIFHDNAHPSHLILPIVERE
jgi:putative CocE/NonD family hydrolase